MRRLRSPSVTPELPNFRESGPAAWFFGPCQKEPESLRDVPSLFVPLQQLENEALGSCYVYILSVVPEMCSLGIGARLLDFAEGFRTERGMSLIVADNNVRAKSLYERCGYREAARRPMCKEGWKSEGQDWILMTKT